MRSGGAPITLGVTWTRMGFSSLSRGALQLQPAKQLSIRSDDDGGEAHCDYANTHGQIETPSDEEATCDGDSDKVIAGRPNKILNHLSIGGPR